MAALTAKQFKARVSQTRLTDGRAVQAAYLVLVCGERPAEAARLIGVNRSAVSRVVKRVIGSKRCPTCGKPA